jgi:hypothetical protein
MHGFKALGFLFAEKQQRASISNQTWWKTINHPTVVIIAMVPLVTLCGRSIKQSQLLQEMDDSNRVS